MQIDISRLLSLGFSSSILRDVSKNFPDGAFSFAEKVTTKFPGYYRYLNSSDPKTTAHQLGIALAALSFPPRLLYTTDLVKILFSGGEPELQALVPHRRAVPVIVLVEKRYLTKMTPVEQTVFRCLLDQDPRHSPLTFVAGGPLESGDTNFRFAVGDHDHDKLKQVKYW